MKYAQPLSENLLVEKSNILYGLQLGLMIRTAVVHMRVCMVGLGVGLSLVFSIRGSLRLGIRPIRVCFVLLWLKGYGLWLA